MQGNLAPNWSFEDGIGSWSSFGSPSTFAQSTAQAYDGLNSLNIVTATSAPRGGDFHPICAASTTYYYSCWNYLTAGSFKLQVDGNSSGTIVNNVSCGAADSTWRQTSTSFTTGASDTSLTCYILSNTAASTGYFDAVRLDMLLFDFQDVTKTGVRSWSLADLDMPRAKAKFVIDVRGTSANDLFDSLALLNRACKVAARNEQYLYNNQLYTPVWLQWQEVTASTMVQTECFGFDADSQGIINNILASPDKIVANRIESIELGLKIRGYFEEQTRQTIASSVSVANAASTTTLGTATARGDSPMPLYIRTRTPTASQDSIVVGLRSLDDPTSFNCRVEVESMTTFGSGVANLADTNLSPTGAGTTGKQWTIPGTSEQMLARWVTSNKYQAGTFRAFLRCRDNHASKNVRIRVKSGITDGGGSNFQYGDWWAAQKYVTTVGGTTTISLIDCGVGQFPPQNLLAQVPTDYVFEIWGQADTTSGTKTFDLDCVYFIPCYEDANGNGFVTATFPFSAGTGAAPDFVIDASDRTAKVYSETSGVPVFVATNVKGTPIFAPPQDQFEIFVLTYNSSAGTHTLGSNIVTVLGTPRFRLGRGT